MPTDTQAEDKLVKAQVNGVTIEYSVVGSGRLIALAHSLGMNSEIFDPLRSPLERYGRVLTWDARGHGASQREVAGWTIEDLAEDLRSLIEQLGEDRAVVGGLSMGGNTAIAYAVKYPDKVDGLILMDTTAWYGEGAAEAWEGRARGVEQNGFEPVIPFNLPRWFSEGYVESSPDNVKRITEILLKNDRVSYAAAGRALGAFDARDGLSRIKCPTLIIVGEGDPATPVPMAAHLHQNIENSTLHVLPGLKHMSAVEAPDRVGNLIAGFLEDLKQR